MKKLAAVIAIFAVVGLSSCAKDNETVPVQKETTSAAEKCRQCGNGSWD